MADQGTGLGVSRAPARILPAIVLAQFAGTSPWFAGNAVMGDIERAFGLGAGAVGALTSAVQLGFIVGTLVFTFAAIADRYSPRVVFLCCAMLSAACNGIAVVTTPTLTSLLVERFCTGFFLAGIYPVGMKIAASWFAGDLGKALGLLVGALVVGTALPHLIRGLGQGLPWQTVMLCVSAIAAAGGVLIYALVPDGPHHRAAAKPRIGDIAAIFKAPEFRASSLGYFGHMWELYAFWAFLPVFLSAYLQLPSADASLVPLLTFLIIALGAVGCVGGGYLSLRRGSAVVATAQLWVSGTCCLLSPVAFFWLPLPLMLIFLSVWGITVVGDSPQFSALNARNAPADRVGTALTFVNCIGFAITIGSIGLLGHLVGLVGEPLIFLLLTPGPIIGVLAMRRLIRAEARHETVQVSPDL